MSFRIRLASSVPLSVLCLFALEAVAPLAGSQDKPQPPSQPAGQPAPTVRPRMREHFLLGAAIRDAIIRADLEAVREPATWLAEHPQDDLPASAEGNVREMQRLSAEVAKAPDLAQASRGMASLAAACGSCHAAVNATPTLIAAMPRGEDESLAGHMRKHYRAADLLYRGLVVPSDHSWNRGADALTGDPVELELKRESAPRPEIEALAKRLHDLAQQARKAENPKSRSAVYGQMLATCSECHKQQNIVIRQGAPRG
jgi:cytochrome c553